MGVNAMTKHPHATQLLDPAEIDRAMRRAKALRAEMLETCCAAMFGLLYKLVSSTFVSSARSTSRSESGERVRVLTQTDNAASKPASAR